MDYYAQKKMSKRGGKIRLRVAMTLLELVIAMAMIGIIFAAILPQFALIRNSWDSKQGIAEALQNGRVLMDHINRNLSKAVRITAVSESSDTDGYIEYEDNDGNTMRYDIAANNYVEYGVVGSLSDLAGPVSSLTFTCYDACDLDNPLSPVTDTNDVRVVRVDATVTNSASMGQNKTFTTWVYLRTNGNANGLVGCWKLDETSGLTAADSSGRGHNGTLVNMAGNEWTTGQINGALAFTGDSDFVQIADLSNYLGTDYTVSWWAKPNTSDWTENILLGNNSTVHDFEYYQYYADLYVRADAGSGADITVSNVYVVGRWVHICGVGDANGTRVYVDGNLAGTTSVKKNTTPNYDLNIGAWATGEWDFNGVIDDVRIYNRVLSAGEIAELANILRYRDFNEAKAGSDVTSLAISTPATNTGDLLIAAVATDGDTSSSLSPPSGWTSINVDDYSGEVTLGAWRRFATASEPASHTFTWTGSQQAYGWMMRFTGHNSASPINNYSTAGVTSSTPTSPAVTTTVGCSMILRLGAFDDGDVNTLPEPGNPGLSGHTAITMDKSGSGSAVPVAILGSWVTDLTHAKESGTNRALLFIAHGECSVPITLNSVTYGGQSMTKVIDRIAGTSDNRDYVAAYILNEAGIAAATSPPGTFAVNWGSQPPDRVQYDSVFLQNVNQTTPIGATDSNATLTGATITTAALATSTGDIVIDAATCGYRGDYTVNNSFIEAYELGVANFDGVAGYKSATGVNETPSVTHSTTTSLQSLIGFVVYGAGITGTVSGGAGYVRQSASGSSGTSTFTLTASNEAQMLTIAIAPANASGYDCCGDYIRP
ncbi:MAG: hypothetical protein MUO27_06955 [Sedimentisphaerales bacterium]|nr:hypothetical protein [Sedimentisphaerales bacterium]